MGWEWEIFLAYGKSSFPHVGILWEFEIPTCGNPMGNRHSHMWESYGKSSFPHVGILWEIVISTCGNPMGIPTEILWEWDGNGNENFLPTATLIYNHYPTVAMFSEVSVLFVLELSFGAAEY